MTRVYDEKYIRSAKRSYALRLCAVILLCMLFCAGYVLSILYPGSKWLTLGIGAAGCIVCCTAALLLLTPAARKYRLLKEIASGLSASDELLFVSCGGTRNFEFSNYSVLVFSGKDNDGRSYERELLFEGKCPFTPGEKAVISSYRGLITAYERQLGGESNC